MFAIVVTQDMVDRGPAGRLGNRHQAISPGLARRQRLPNQPHERITAVAGQSLRVDRGLVREPRQSKVLPRRQGIRQIENHRCVFPMMWTSVHLDQHCVMFDLAQRGRDGHHEQRGTQRGNSTRRPRRRRRRQTTSNLDEDQVR